MSESMGDFWIRKHAEWKAGKLDACPICETTPAPVTPNPMAGFITSDKIVEFLDEYGEVEDALNEHWPTWVEGVGFVEALGVCACGKAKADGVRPYKTIWSEHMGELVREALAAAKEPRG